MLSPGEGKNKGRERVKERRVAVYSVPPIKKKRPAIISGCRITTSLRGTYPCIYVSAYPTRSKHQSEEADLSPKRAGMSVCMWETSWRKLWERFQRLCDRDMWPHFTEALLLMEYRFLALLVFFFPLSFCFFTLFFCVCSLLMHTHTHVPLTLIIVRHLCPSWPLHKQKKGGINEYASTA